MRSSAAAISSDELIWPVWMSVASSPAGLKRSSDTGVAAYPLRRFERLPQRWRARWPSLPGGNGE
jgi:hypothetical protein